MRQHTLRILLQLLGFVSLALGIAGAFLPLLPTTPFILLSGWCFAKSSPKWSAYIHSHREFGPLIHNWKTERSISRRHKLTACTMLTISIVGILLTDQRLVLKAGLCVGLLCIVVFLLMTKTADTRR